MRRLLALTVIAAAASAAVTAAPAAADCTYAGTGDIDARLCVESTCSDLCWTTITPSCTGLPVDCDFVQIRIGPY